MNYTSNLCPNPSFELDLTGYTALPDTTITQTFQDSFSGTAAMSVQTAGTGSGEGFYGPAVTYPASVSGSLSVALSGPSGQVQVSAVVNPGGVVLASQVVSLTNPWQRVYLSDLNIQGGTSLYVLVQTPTPQVLSFRVDAVMYEPESPDTSHAYCDGSLPGCYWTGAPHASASFQPVQFPVNLVGGMQVSGTATVIQPGEIISLAIPSGSIVSGGQVTGLTVTEPAAAFDDFALFELADLDPACSYAGWNNANALSGKTSYNRSWATFYPPLDYPASDGTLMWPRAAYVAMGFEYVNIPAGAAQNMTLMQAEALPLVAGTPANGLDGGPLGLAQAPPVPSGYDTPRSIHTIIKPTRLNYCPNPSFESGLTSWTLTLNPSTGAALVQDHSQVCYQDGLGNEVGLATDSWSMNVVSHSAADGAQVTVPGLFVGETYTASIYVLPGTGTADIAFTAGQYVGGVPGYAVDALLSGSTSTPPDLTPGQWVRTQVTFIAATSTMVLTLTPVLSTTTSPPSSLIWNADCCLIEAGEIADSYFDGNFGTNYQWESGGTVTNWTTQTWTFEGGIGSWADAENCTPSYSTTYAHSGKGSLRMASTAHGTVPMAAASAAGAHAVTAGIPVASVTTAIPVSAWFRAGSTPRQCQVGVAFYRADGTWINPTQLGSWVTDTTYGWTQVTASVLVPPGAAYGLVQVQAGPNGTAQGEYHYVDDVTMTSGETVAGSGTANQSRSYYYENYAVNQEVITDILDNHTPLGITPAMPLYSVPPSQ